MLTTLLDRTRDCIRDKDYSPATEKAYIYWIREYIRYNELRDPTALNQGEAARFITYVADSQNAAASTRNQALNALVFLYKYVLQMPLQDDKLECRASKTKFAPQILTRDEVREVIFNLNGVHRIIGALLYGTGIKLMECLRIRIADLDFDTKTLKVFDRNGLLERTVILPDSLITPLRHQVQLVLIKYRCEENQLMDSNQTDRPASLGNAPCKNRNSLQYLFPSIKRESKNKNRISEHISVSTFQKAIRTAIKKSELHQTISASTLRHSAATHLLESGMELHVVQNQLGHKSISSTQAYIHFTKPSNQDLNCPLDDLFPSHSNLKYSSSNESIDSTEEPHHIKAPRAHYLKNETSRTHTKTRGNLIANPDCVSLMPLVNNLIKSHQQLLPNRY